MLLASSVSAAGADEDGLRALHVVCGSWACGSRRTSIRAGAATIWGGLSASDAPQSTIDVDNPRPGSHSVSTDWREHGPGCRYIRLVE